MKKFIYSLMAVAMLTATPLLFTSCGGDDDSAEGPATPSYEAPKYAAEAKKIANLADNKQGWSSIEFTESGIVIVKIRGTRAADETVITGVYAVLSDGNYSITLPEYTGTVKVSGDGTITVGDEEIKGTYVAGDASADTQMLSRTWLINRYVKIDGIRVDLRDRKEFEKTGYPTEFTVTKAGTFMVSFSGGTSEAGTWVWNKKGESINISEIASYIFEGFVMDFSQVVTVHFTIDGTEYEGYLTEKK